MSYLDTNPAYKRIITRKPKVQFCRKLGHLWQVAYGPTVGEGVYGYGVTRKEAGSEARARFVKWLRKRLSASKEETV